MIHLPNVKLAFVSVFAMVASRTAEGIVGFTMNLAPGWTQSNAQRFAQLISSPQTGTPDNKRTPGGTRTEFTGTKLPEACQQTAKAFTALVPIKGSESLTTAEHPVFWFYIPDAPEDIDSIEFSLHDRGDTTTFYRTSLQLTKTPGVIGIPLPPSPKSSLKLNESYRWNLIVNCTPQTKPEDALALEGWVTRVQPSPNLVGAIWYNELTNRAKRFLLEPQNPEVKKAWTELLKSVDLEEVAQAPVVSSVGNPKKD